MPRAFGLPIAILVALFAQTIVSGCGTPAHDHHDQEARPARMHAGTGDHSFAITTRSPLAQQWFDQGLNLAYGFNHEEAKLSFEECAKADPDAAMCWWGVAYVLGPNYNLPGDPERDREAYAAVQKARALSGASARERDYVEAVTARYSAEAPQDRSALDQKYAAALAKLAKKYPDDLDAQTLYAESLMDLQPWDLWTAEGQPKGRALEIVSLIEGVLERDSSHPGANHLYIHAVEASQHPERGTAAADRLRAQNLTAAGHLVHMPSHIYARTGRYADATQANVDATEADEAFIAKWKPAGPYPMMYYPHNVDFQSFAAAMEARSEQAIENARKSSALTTPEMVAHMAMLENYVPRALFALVRFGRFDEILAEPAPAPQLRYATGVWHWARGLAFVGKGQLRDADREAAALAKIEREMPADVFVTQVNKGKTLLGIASNWLAGEIAAKRGRTDEAVKRLEHAVALEDTLTYMEPPDWFNPARHALGAVLLDAGRAKEAEAIYRADLQRNRENGWALAGLSQSLRKQRKTTEAAQVETRLAKAWARADVKPTSSRY